MVAISILSVGPAVWSQNAELLRESTIQLSLAALAAAFCMLERSYGRQAEADEALPELPVEADHVAFDTTAEARHAARSRLTLVGRAPFAAAGETDGGHGGDRHPRGRRDMLDRVIAELMLWGFRGGLAWLVAHETGLIAAEKAERSSARAGQGVATGMAVTRSS